MVVLHVIRGLAEEISAKADFVRPLSYLSSFYRGVNSSDVILIFKEGQNTSKNNVSTVIEPVNKDDSIDYELDGNPLENPFEDIDADTSVVCDKQFFEAWQKSEENFLPLSLRDARYFAYRFAGKERDLSSVEIPDIWIVSTSGDETKVNRTIVLGLRGAPDGVKRNDWFSRSDVRYEGLSGTDGPLMDPAVMKQQHLKLCAPSMNLQSEVVCTYQLCGQRSFDEDASHQLSPLDSVALEVKWRQPKLIAPVHEATATMVIQAIVGNEENSAYSLWKQLWKLEKLSGVISTAWQEKKHIEKLPTFATVLYHSFSEEPERVSVVDRLKTLFKRGVANISNIRHGNRLTEDVEDSFQSSLLRKSVEKALSADRIDKDSSDDLWTILSDCETYKELSNALDMVYREIRQGHWKPYVRHKNQSRTSCLLRTLHEDSMNSYPDMTVFDGSGVLYAAESLFELGLEKLSLDYIHIFIESGLASRDEIFSPPFPRKGPGVSQDAWLASCNVLLNWMAKMHAAVEVVLHAEAALSGTLSSQPSEAVASEALSYFQGGNSPVSSAKVICSSSRFKVNFRATISCHQIDFLLSQKFDCWELTLTSANATRQVESVFHRSCYPIFPPQLVPCNTELPTQDKEALPYFCSTFTTITNRG